MWWPATWRQSAARIARYDWLVVGPGDRPNVPALRARNRDLIVLTSTNACELAYNASPDADRAENAAVRAVPGAWFLTQVGSTLTAAVGAEETILRVAALTARQSGSALQLFVPGDYILIEEEIAEVVSVDTAAKTLHVRRGRVRPAASHGVGTRVAALIRMGPNGWMLDISTYCPRATVDPTAGPESWAEYNARVAAGLLADPIWDGILLDRTDPDESWIIGNSTARSIDAERSNRPVGDGYAAFDAAWNSGLRRYETRLRELVGDDRIVLTNWGCPNYDLLNGTNFEGFPDSRGTGSGTAWPLLVFGPHLYGSYLQWLSACRQPNLTTVQTFEEDGNASDVGEFQNPAAKPGFRPNYRKMRFGLCTALLGDGFFIYEISTHGHGSLGLLWFDEYDNAGKGRGYLGKPLGKARRAVSLPTSRSLTAGGRLNTAADFRRWRLVVHEDEGYRATAQLDSLDPARGRAAVRVDISRAYGIDWRVSLDTPVSVRAGRDYTASFWARADRERTIDVWVQESRPPWRSRIEYDKIRLGTRWKRYVLCAPSKAADSGALFHFGLGEAGGSVWLDDIKLQQGNAEVWRRDFKNGVALVNAGTTPRTVLLHGTYRHIRGRQVPSVNTGRLARRVTLRPRDGVILIRTARQRNDGQSLHAVPRR